MKKVMWPLTFMMVLCLVAASASADGPKKKGGPPKEKPLPGCFRLPPQVELSAEQKVKFDAIVAKYLPRVKRLDEKVEAVWTDEQKSARDAARKEAHDTGLRGKEAEEKVKASVVLTEKQAATLAVLKETEDKMDDEIKDIIKSLLTPEQKQLLERKGPPHGDDDDGERKGPPHKDRGDDDEEDGERRGPPHRDDDRRGPPHKGGPDRKGPPHADDDEWD